MVLTAWLPQALDNLAATSSLEVAVVVDELEIPLGINLAAVGVGAVVGTLRAGDSEDIDVVGMFGLALCFGFGGGLVRDVLLGNLPPYAFRSPVYLITVLVATVFGSVFLVYLDHFEKPLWVGDSMAIGLFAAVGTNAALLADLPFLPAVFVGSLASVGGLVLADMLQARPSALLHRGPPNVLAGLAAAMVYGVLYDEVSEVLVTILAVSAAFLVRLASYYFKVQAPMPIRQPLAIRSRFVYPSRRQRSSLITNVRAAWGKVGAGRGGQRDSGQGDVPLDIGPLD